MRNRFYNLPAEVKAVFNKIVDSCMSIACKGFMFNVQLTMYNVQLTMYNVQLKAITK
jgi:hypothetical protein